MKIKSLPNKEEEPINFQGKTGLLDSDGISPVRSKIQPENKTTNKNI